MKTLEHNSFITSEPKGPLPLSSASDTIPTPYPELFAAVDRVGTVIRLEFL